MEAKISSHPELVKKFPPEVKKIFTIFGDDIRLVGGSVRDLLLQKKVKDFDFATRFLPEEVIEILGRNKIKSVPTGVKFGTVTAVINHKNFEITTLRRDQEHKGRHCEVEFVDDYFFDASRRDFTINALYLDSKGFVHDYFDGVSDLKNKKVRFIGEAARRIEEDFLRILRFFRFSCEYAEKIDAEGLASCIEQKENLKKLSRERIRQEILKLISSEKKDRVVAILKILKSKKIAEEIFSSSLDIPAFERLSDGDEKLKIAVLFLNKTIDLKKFFSEICATNQEKKYFQFILAAPQKLDLSSIKQFLAFHDKKLVLDLCHFYRVKKNQKFSPKILQFINDFAAINFPLNGEDVMQLGFSGEAIGEAIMLAKKFWAENDFNPRKSDLLNFLKKRGGQD